MVTYTSAEDYFDVFREGDIDIISSAFGKEGFTSKKDINLYLDTYTSKYFRINKIRQAELEYLVERVPQTVKGIFFREMYCRDLSPLSKLKNVEIIKILRNPYATELWDMSKTKIVALSINQFIRTKDFSLISTAGTLESLVIDYSIRPTMTLNTLLPLKYSNIIHLKYGMKKVIDNDFSYLTSMNRLRTLIFPLNFHRTEEVAWMVANLPNVVGRALKPFEIHQSGWLHIIGKGKPRFEKFDNDTISKYVSKFEALVEYYKHNDHSWN